MFKRLFSFAAVAVMVMAVLAACGAPSDKVEPTVTRIPVTTVPAETPTSEAVEATQPSGGAESTEPAGAATEITVIMGKPTEFAFDPSEFTIPANTDVTIHLKNEGNTIHDFSIDELKIAETLDAGKDTTFTIKAAAGDYQYYCNVPGHKEAGMVGTLHVVAGGAGDAGSDTAASTAPAEESTSAASSSAEASGSAADEVKVVMGKPTEFAFDPSEFTIPANTDVTVSITNEGQTIHDFSIDELDIALTLDAGADGTVKINAAPGDYQYYCNVPGHKEAGMVGTLHVK